MARIIQGVIFFPAHKVISYSVILCENLSQKLQSENIEMSVIYEIQVIEKTRFFADYVSDDRVDSKSI